MDNMLVANHYTASFGLSFHIVYSNMRCRVVICSYSEVNIEFINLKWYELWLRCAVNLLLWIVGSEFDEDVFMFQNDLQCVRFQALTAANMKMAVFWVVAPRSRSDDGGSKDLWNVGKFLPDYTAQQPRRQPSSNYNVVITYFNFFFSRIRFHVLFRFIIKCETMNSLQDSRYYRLDGRSAVRKTSSTCINVYIYPCSQSERISITISQFRDGQRPLWRWIFSCGKQSLLTSSYVPTKSFRHLVRDISSEVQNKGNIIRHLLITLPSRENYVCLGLLFERWRYITVIWNNVF
jgi:hypothetical protein